MLLQVSKYNQSIFGFPLAEDQVSIGRAPSNDIILTDPSISRTHALVTTQNQQWILTDRSQNGTRINGEIVHCSEIAIGSKIELGPYAIELVKKTAKSEDTLILQQKDLTQMLSYNQQRNEVVTGKVELRQTKPIQRKHKISKSMTTLGKDAQNDITLMDDYISGFHCKIEMVDDTYILKDLGSTNGTVLNGQKVREAQLQHGDELSFGKTSLIFSHVRAKKTIQATQATQFSNIISHSENMQNVFSLIETVAPTDAAVFIHGETGTGKELVARAVAQKSSRSQQPFLTINCGAISKDLIESELFGHEKGAFTSAHQQRQGLFEQAHKGTLFLDEIGELPIDLQPKLLRVLETGEIRRVGGDQTIFVDVRIVSATHRDLHQQVAQQRFREDLLYRLHVIPIELPPLRQRKQDIPHLVSHFLQTDAQKYQQPVKKITDGALELLTQHSWPGNIRELKNIVQRAIILAHQEPEIDLAHIQFHTSSAQSQSEVPQGSLADVEKKAIEHALQQNKWNKTKTAQALGIAKSTLHIKIQQYAIVQQ